MKLVQVRQGDLRESHICQITLFLAWILCCWTDSGETSSYKEAMLAQDKPKWELTMKSELQSIEKNKTWDMFLLPKGKQALPCKWVYERKFASGVGTYKAQLVAKGFKKEYGIDFEKIFSPVVKMTCLKLFLGLVATQDLELV